MVNFTDEFNRAPAGGAPLLGAPWVDTTGSWSISANAAYPTATGFGGMCVATVETSEANGEIEALFHLDLSNSSGVGICYRVQDANNYRYAIVYKSGAGNYSLYSGRLLAGVQSYDHFSNLSNGNQSPVGRRLKATFTGNNVQVYWEGVAVGALFTAAGFLTNTKHGVHAIQAYTGTVDAFSFIGGLWPGSNAPMVMG